MLAGPAVRSAILLGNQAESGFRVDNQAGTRTQAVANEEDPIEKSPEARSHYRVDVGSMGDGRYVREFNGREGRPFEGVRKTSRWSSASSQLCLPVVPGKPYHITIELLVPPQAVSPDAGLYLGDQRIATFDHETSKLTGELPPCDTDQRILELRCRGWIPKALMPASNDDRTLGVTVFALTLCAADADERVFDANLGDWINTVPLPDAGAKQ